MKMHITHSHAAVCKRAFMIINDVRWLQAWWLIPLLGECRIFFHILFSILDRAMSCTSTCIRDGVPFIVLRRPRYENEYQIFPNEGGQLPLFCISWVDGPRLASSEIWKLSAATYAYLTNANMFSINWEHKLHKVGFQRMNTQQFNDET